MVRRRAGSPLGAGGAPPSPPPSPPRSPRRPLLLGQLAGSSEWVHVGGGGSNSGGSSGSVTPPDGSHAQGRVPGGGGSLRGGGSGSGRRPLPAWDRGARRLERAGAAGGRGFLTGAALRGGLSALKILGTVARGTRRGSLGIGKVRATRPARARRRRGANNSIRVASVDHSTLATGTRAWQPQSVAPAASRSTVPRSAPKDPTYSPKCHAHARRRADTGHASLWRFWG